jgi:hypothetical protein
VRSVPLAVTEALGANVILNLFDQATHAHPEEFYVSWQSIWHNIQEGFEWDDNHFTTNNFAHPYNGNIFFNAGRSNGLNYYESMPLTAAGSLTWEYAGEVNRPSFNDFINTTVGGIALGEIFHRTAATVRDNTATGSRRVWREVAGFLIDPVGGFNRIFRGEMSRVYGNPPEHDPSGLSAWLRFGVRSRGDENFRFGSETTGSVTDFRLYYGDPFGKADKPFDTYSFRIEAASADSGLLNGVRGEGLIVALSHETEQPNMHRYVLTQCFDFFDNAAYQYGGQSVQFRWLKRWQKAPEASHVSAMVGGQFIILGAVNSEHTGLTQRSYDYGPGLGTDIVFTWIRHRYPLLRGEYSIAWLDTKAGDNASHWLHRGDLEATYLFTDNIGLSAAAGYFRRDSYYDNAPDVHQWSPEWRAGLTLRTH